MFRTRWGSALCVVFLLLGLKSGIAQAACPAGTAASTGSVTLGDGTSPSPGWFYAVYANNMPAGNFPWTTTNPTICLTPGTYQIEIRPGSYWDAHDPNDHLVPYPTYAVTCNPTQCQGAWQQVFFTNFGNFHGHVVRLPGGPVATGVWAKRITPGTSVANFGTPSDTSGHYDFNVFKNFADPWGVWLNGGWGAAQQGVYRLSTAVDNYTYSIDTALTSNENVDVSFAYFAPDIEQQPLRCDPEGGPSTTPHPVHVVSGNVFLDHTDVTIPGVSQNSLDFVRSYNSLNGAPGQFGVFGPGWSHSYEATLTFPAVGRVSLRLADGQSLYYEDPDGDLTYAPFYPVTERSTIVKEADGTYVRNLRSGAAEQFDAQGRLTALVDPVGNVTALTRNGAGQITSIADPGGRVLTLSYSGATVESLSGPAGVIATYAYDVPGLLSSVTYADGSGYDYAYDSANRLLTVTDKTGTPLESHTYDANGRAATSALSGNVEQRSFVYASGQTTVTDALGNVTTYQFRPFWGVDKVTRLTGPCSSCGGGGNQTQTWAYDAKGRILRHSDGLGNTTSFSYDPVTGDKLAETDPLGKTTSYTYDAQGRVLTKTDPIGGLRTYTYGAAGPLTITEKVTASSARTTTISYTTQGKLQTTTDPLGKCTTFVYGSFGDLESVTDPLGCAGASGHTTTYEYDSMGRRTSATDPPDAQGRANKTTFSYDERGRLLGVTRPDMSHTGYVYDLGGRRTSVTDAAENETRYEYDPYGRLWRVIDALGGITEYGYDAMSQLITLKDAKQQATGKATGFTYDAYGRVSKVTYPSGALERFTYDNAGRLATKTDRKNIVTTYTYDADGRLTKKSYSSGGNAVTYGYDGVGRLTLAGYLNASGVLITAGSLNWTYDLAGQMTQAKRNGGLILNYDYDLDGRRIAMKIGAAIYSTYGYDDASRLTSITRSGKVFQFAYDNASHRTTLTFPNGVVTSYGYDVDSQLTSVGAVKAATVVTQTGYTYDAVGNRVTKATPTVTEDYTYDPLYRLTNVLQGATETEDYTYDPVGNRLSALSVPSWTYDDDNRLLSNTSATFTHDANGNLTKKVEAGITWIYTWDAENRLLSVKKGATIVASFTYDALGRRSTKTVGTTTATYEYDAEDIFRQLSGAAVSGYWIHGPGIDEPLAWESASAVLTYMHADGLGSIIKQTNQAGTMASPRTYTAFGVPSGTIPGNYAFTGREWDPETGLYYYRARYYDSRVGRFISEDPALFGGDDNNLYNYVWANPVNFTDPSGLVGLFGGAGLSGDAGYWWGGMGAQGGIGGAFCFKGFNPFSKPNLGAFAQGGGFVGFFGTGNGLPGNGHWKTKSGQPGGDAGVVVGVAANAGWNGGITNADCACELRGPFGTLTLNTPYASVQFQKGSSETGRTIWTLGVSGPSPKASVSYYTTTTAVKQLFDGDRSCGCK